MSKAPLEKDLLEEAIGLLSRNRRTGVTYEELAEGLGKSLQEARRIAEALVEAGIARKEARKTGKKKVEVIVPSNGILLLSIPVSLETVARVPCFKCRYLLVCKPGETPNPASCSVLDSWLAHDGAPTSRRAL